jgi:hypothetical protein
VITQASVRLNTLRRAFFGDEDASPPSFWLTGGSRAQPHSFLTSSYPLVAKGRVLQHGRSRHQKGVGQRDDREQPGHE